MTVLSTGECVVRRLVKTGFEFQNKVCISSEIEHLYFSWNSVPWCTDIREEGAIKLCEISMVESS